MNASNLLFGVLLTVIRFQFSEALKGVDLINLAPRKPDYTKTLILDLDETLIHGYQSRECDGKESFQIKINYLGHPYSYCIDLREGVVETLNNLEKGIPEGDRWELVIWTAGSNDYADKIMEYLQKQKGITISHVIGKETSLGGMKGEEKHRFKDIRRLINADSGKDQNPRTLETMVIVDNKPEHCYPGENTIGICTWWGYNEEIPQWFKNRVERSYTGSISGHDGGEAMKQLKVELDELTGKRITLERLGQKLHQKASERMIYYREQPLSMSKQIEMVNKSGRDDKYRKTVILDLFEDFVYINNNKGCGATKKCWEIRQGGYKWSVEFRADALNTLRTLQQVTTDWWQSDELIIWTNGSRELAEKISAKMSSREGIDIAHVLGTNDWDNAKYHFEENWMARDITRLDSDTRPLDSMVITNKDPIQCLPQANTVGIRALYSSKQIEKVKEAGRDRQYTKTLIMNLEQDFVYIEKDTESLKCEEKEDCWELLHCGFTYAVQFRGDAINTLQKLQQVEPGRDRWELIIWTDFHRKFADKISQILSSKGVDIAHILDGNNWNNVVGGSLDPPNNKEWEVKENNKEWKVKDITRLASDRRPLDSMIIVHNRPSRCLPHHNTVGIRPWYGYNKSLQDLYKWHEYNHLSLRAAQTTTKYIDLLLRWPQFGSDDRAMKELKFVLDKLDRQSIGDETLRNAIFSEPATTDLVRLPEQMVFFQSVDGSQRITETKARTPEPTRVWRHLIPRQAAEAT